MSGDDMEEEKEEKSPWTNTKMQEQSRDSTGTQGTPAHRQHRFPGITWGTRSYSG